jgi:hypothetical protein
MFRMLPKRLQLNKNLAHLNYLSTMYRDSVKAYINLQNEHINLKKSFLELKNAYIILLMDKNAHATSLLDQNASKNTIENNKIEESPILQEEEVGDQSNNENASILLEVEAPACCDLIDLRQSVNMFIMKQQSRKNKL